jgi:hypothetical protein
MHLNYASITNFFEKQWFITFEIHFQSLIIRLTLTSVVNKHIK